MSQQRSERATTEACSYPATAPPGGDLRAGHQRPDLWGNLQRQPARTHRPRGVSSETPAGTTVRSEFETDETETGEDQSVIERRFFCLTGGRRRAFRNGLYFFFKLALKVFTSYRFSAFKWDFSVRPDFWTLRLDFRIRFPQWKKCFAFWKLRFKQVFWRERLWRKSPVPWACQRAGKWLTPVDGQRLKFCVCHSEISWKVNR